MTRPCWIRLAAGLALLGLLGCADSYELTYARTRLVAVPAHTYLAAVAQSALPGDLEVEGSEAVVLFENRTPGRLAVAVEGRPAGEGAAPCPRTVGFVQNAASKLAHTDGALPPAGFAAICFHQAGEYRYELWLDGKEHGSGTIRVKPAPQAERKEGGR